MTKTFVLDPQGAFSLREAALFGFGPRDEQSFDGTMRLAFCVDGYRDQAGVELRQSADGKVHGRIHGTADPAVVRAQAARVLSLDHDGAAFAEVASRDPAIGLLQRTAPGLRPVLFHSPYEAAAWSVISARRPRAQAIVLRTRLSQQYGRAFTLAGEEQPAFPTPEALLTVDELPGLPTQRIGWLHGVARAALRGQLDADTLAAQDPDAAMAGLRRLAGIGPFYAALVQLRGTGATDVLPTNEPRVLEAASRLYGAPVTQADFERRAEQWRPWRTWACVLIRAVTGRLATADLATADLTAADLRPARAGVRER
jgi:DNA-3-methyladenine glycosylase II